MRTVIIALTAMLLSGCALLEPMHCGPKGNDGGECELGRL